MNLMVIIQKISKILTLMQVIHQILPWLNMGEKMKLQCLVPTGVNRDAWFRPGQMKLQRLGPSGPDLILNVAVSAAVSRFLLVRTESIVQS